MQGVFVRGQASSDGESILALRAAVQAGGALFDCLPIAVCAFDCAGALVAANAKAAELCRGPATGGAWLELLSLPPPVRDREMTFTRADGSIATVLASVNPVFDDEGEAIGAVCCAQDITELKRTQQDLAARERWYEDILESLPAPIYTTDEKGVVTFYNRAAADFAGREPEPGVDRWCVSWRMRAANGEPMPVDDCAVAQAIEDQRPIRGHEAVAERPDGTRVPFLAYPTPLRNGRGELVGAVNMLLDLTDRKQAEEQHRAMLAELNHRVKNTLATVLSIAQQTSRTAPDPASFSSSFEARVLALSAAHDILARNGWTGADLLELVRRELEPYRRADPDQITIGGPKVVLQPRVALALGMVVHELAANAARHGSLATLKGRLSVEWRVTAHGSEPSTRALSLDWIETGGPPATAPLRRGFGLRLINHSVTRDLNGRANFDFGPSGLSCRIETPVWPGPG